MNHQVISSGWKTGCVTVIAWLIVGLSAGAGRAANGSLPHLEAQGTAKRLMVDGKPFLILGGELGNSAGEPDYLRQFWPKLKGLNLNTVIAPVYWDVIEPVEGEFDFATVDGLLRDARGQNLRLVLLWFGTWKNSMSCYTPGWVKTNLTRFPGHRIAAGIRWRCFHRSATPISRRMRARSGR